MLVVKLKKKCPCCYQAVFVNFNLLTGRSKVLCNNCGESLYLSIKRRYYVPYFVIIIMFAYALRSLTIFDLYYYWGLTTSMLLILLLGIISYLFLSTLKIVDKG